jgi:hypothetical protein
MNKKIVIMVTGSHRKSENHIECEQTWIPKLREMGFDVFVALGNVDVENYGHLTLNDFKNYYEFINEHTIQFRTFDSKVGLFDKSIKLPIQWILENTNYEYYFRIDSDSFVHPERFVTLEIFQMLIIWDVVIHGIVGIHMKNLEHQYVKLDT